MGCSSSRGSGASALRVLEAGSGRANLRNGEVLLTVESLQEDFKPLEIAAHRKAEVSELCKLVEAERGVPVRQQILTVGDDGDRLRPWANSTIGKAAEGGGRIVLKVAEPPKRARFVACGRGALISGPDDCITTHITDSASAKAVAKAARGNRLTTGAAENLTNQPVSKSLSDQASPKPSPKASPAVSPANSPRGSPRALSPQLSPRGHTPPAKEVVGGRPSLSVTNLVADDDSGPVYGEFRVVSGRDRDGVVCSCIGAVVQKDVKLNGWHNSSSNNDAYFVEMAKGGPLGQGQWTEAHEGAGVNKFKPGDTLGVLVLVGKKGFVRFYKDGKRWGDCFKGTPERPIKSPLVIAVHSSDKGLAYELLPEAATPTG